MQFSNIWIHYTGFNSQFQYPLNRSPLNHGLQGHIHGHQRNIPRPLKQNLKLQFAVGEHMETADLQLQHMYAKTQIELTLKKTHHYL